jgi:hypothetical protein
MLVGLHYGRALDSSADLILGALAKVARATIRSRAPSPGPWLRRGYPSCAGAILIILVG